jgi:TolB-like protein
LKIDRLIRDITRTITPGKLGRPVAVASFVDLDKLNSTNTLGRFLTEGVMDRMSSRGYTIVETRAARELMTQTNVGEQALSREPEEMKGGAAADFVVLGTYTMSGDTLSVHARLVKPESRQVVAKGMFQMNVRPGDPFMKRMFEAPFERVGENNYSEGSRKK